MVVVDLSNDEASVSSGRLPRASPGLRPASALFSAGPIHGSATNWFTKPSQAELDRLLSALIKRKRSYDVEVDHDSVVFGPLDPTPEQMQRLWANYLANVTMIDEKIGETPGEHLRSGDAWRTP